MLPHEIVMTFRDLFLLQNTIHWINSIAIEDHCSRRPAGDAPRFPPALRVASARQAGKRLQPSSLLWPFQANQLKTVSQRLPRIRFSFHEVRSRRTGPACAWRSVSGQKQHFALLSILAERICVAAGIRGSFRMRQFRAARKNVRIPRHFLPSSSSGAPNCKGASRVETDA